MEIESESYKNNESIDNNEDVGYSFLLKPFYFVLFIWFVFWIDQRFMLDLYRLGIYPGKFSGITGIFTTPFIHGSLAHLSNNTFPLLALGAGLYYFYPRIATRVVIVSWLASGIMVWLIGRESYHIGASGLIYALAGFIFLCGILRRQSNLLSLSLLVVFLYGSLVWGILPIEESISWEAHLAGAFSGFALAFHYRKTGPRRKIYSWEREDEDEAEGEIIDITTVEEHPEPEVWENYSKSSYGIRYYYKTKADESIDTNKK